MKRLLALALLLIANQAFAHHSFAMYDSAQLIHIVGTVKSFQWTNPHVMVWVAKDEPAGELWTIELPTSPGNLARMGWSKLSLKPGDRVDIEVNPLRDGQHAGSFKKATLAETGIVLTAQPVAPEKKDAPEPQGKEAARDCGDVADEHAVAAPPVSSGRWAGPALAVALAAVVYFVRRFRRVTPTR